MSSTRENSGHNASAILSRKPDAWAVRTEQLRGLVSQAVAATRADGILLSGGLDTSILATVAAKQGRRLRALSVSVANAFSPDEPFARALAQALELEHHVLRPTLSELLAKMPEVIRVLKTFDPMELRNSVVTHAALQAAQRLGVQRVLTGDAADELFAGYRYMFTMPAHELPAYIRHLDGIMHFTSLDLGQALAIGVELPYLDRRLREFALTLDADDLVGEQEGRQFGKKILREGFADLLPPEITWRPKTPIESGSGSTDLTRAAIETVTDSDFSSDRQKVAQQDGVRLRDKEQYFYYRLYRSTFPPPAQLPAQIKSCAECKGPVSRIDMRYCRICGAYPI